MKKISLTLLCYICFSLQYIHAQEITKSLGKDEQKSYMPQKRLNGITTVTTSKGDRSTEILPAKGSERFKIKLEIPKEASFFAINAEQFEYGNHKESFLSEDIASRQISKGEKRITFELVPDVSKPNHLIIFSYFPGMTSFNYMHCPEEQNIKYKLFKKSEYSYTHKTPIMLFYADNKENQVEKIVNKYIVNDSITQKPSKYNKLIKEIPHCMLIHYKIE